jgi:glycosyltransferase involved in cell wall biosynthesis
MITRKVDRADHLAGFTHAWVKKIDEQLRQHGGALTVICLDKGDVTGLEHVAIHSLGKELGFGRLHRWWKFQVLAWQLVRQADAIFCHMNPEYTIAIAPYAKLFGKKIVSWYTHSAVTFRLWLVTRLANVILTASAESFRMKTKKLMSTGHGIDTEIFKPLKRESTVVPRQRMWRLVTIGRISPTKDYESMIKAIQLLVGRGIVTIHLDIIGGPGLIEHQNYYNELKNMVDAMQLQEYVSFIGPVSHQLIAQQLQCADIFINLSNTGSLDKAVLEAMACECLVITSNTAFRQMLPSTLIVGQNNPIMLADRIQRWCSGSAEESELVARQLREIVVRKHNLDGLIQNILGICAGQIADRRLSNN